MRIGVEACHQACLLSSAAVIGGPDQHRARRPLTPRSTSTLRTTSGGVARPLASRIPDRTVHRDCRRPSMNRLYHRRNRTFDVGIHSIIRLISSPRGVRRGSRAAAGFSPGPVSSPPCQSITPAETASSCSDSTLKALRCRSRGDPRSAHRQGRAAPLQRAVLADRLLSPTCSIPEDATSGAI